jgi:hypothetical protein
MLFVGLANASFLPSSWWDENVAVPEKGSAYAELSSNPELSDFEKTVVVVDKAIQGSKFETQKGFGLKGFSFDFGISESGRISLLPVKGQSAVKIFWTKKGFLPAQDFGADLELSANDKLEDIERKIDLALKTLDGIRTIKDMPKVKGEMMAIAKRFYEIGIELRQNPSPFYTVTKYYLEREISVQNIQTSFRLGWKFTDNQKLEESESAKTIRMIVDQMVLSEQDLALPKGFKVAGLKIGVGFGKSVGFGVFKSSFAATGILELERTNLEPLNFESAVDEDEEIYLIDKFIKKISLKDLVKGLTFAHKMASNVVDSLPAGINSNGDGFQASRVDLAHSLSANGKLSLARLKGQNSIVLRYEKQDSNEARIQ